MGFRVIKGTFHVVGYSPDGDSLRFMAANEDNWDLLGGPPQLAINSKKHVQLRLEAIDTLETHFSAPGGTLHQPPLFADAATDFLLAGVGVTGVVWNPNRTKVTAAADGTPGYILSRQKDSNGRPISFVFAGDTADADGADVFFDTTRLKGSLNYKSIVGGHAYATFYTGLFSDLRAEMAAAVAAARAANVGLFAADKTTLGFNVGSLAAITDMHVVMPKLFRRLAEYIAGDTTPDLSGFKDFLEAKNEQVLDLTTMNFTHFDDLVEVVGQTVRLLVAPEHMVFKE